MNDYLFGILKNEMDEDSNKNWVNSCRKLNLKFELIDLFKNDWLDHVVSTQYSYFLACPPGLQSHFKNLYDERINILSNVLKMKVYPSYEEIVLHENKRFLSYWLKANNLPHPTTSVFYLQNEALDYINSCAYPFVAKMNIGASGSGVTIIRNKAKARNYVNHAFSKNGIRSKIGPNLKMGNTANRLKKILTDYNHLKSRVNVYSKIFNDPQKNFVIFQQHISHDFEWRIVRIGDSYFGHKKTKLGDKCSGTKGIEYTPPSPQLLHFVKDICEKFNFQSMAIDLFEPETGNYLINEMQTIFGHVQKYILEVNGKPGRFIYKDDQWKFEEGLFNTNLSYDLRLQNVLQILKQNGKYQ